MIIINDQPAAIRCDNNLAVNVSGPQLVTVDDFVMINDTSFQRKLPGIASVPLLNITGYDTIVSLPFLHQLSDENLRSINKVRDNAQNDFSPIVRPGIKCLHYSLRTHQHHLQKKRNDFQVNQLMDNLGGPRTVTLEERSS